MMCMAPECLCRGFTCCGQCLESQAGCMCVSKWARLSEDRNYRYALGREWGSAPQTLVVVGLNPSTADETEDDPTIRRCVGFAKGFGCARLLMLNLFAYRSTDPAGLRKVLDPVGPENDRVLREVLDNPDALIVAAWGVHGKYLSRDAEVRRLFKGRLHHLGLTKDGHPKHPLYLRSDTLLTPWHR
jgi:hypothetical protein